MTKQELARARNTNKWLLTGSYKPYNTEALTSIELDLIDLINRSREQLLEYWDENSRLLGLNVPEHKCYYPNCKNKAKYLFDNNNYSCKTHLEGNINYKLIKKDE